MDGMGDLDNAPMPPMGPDDDMGMNDPMGGDDPNAMGGDEPPMGGPDDMGGGNGHEELMQIADQLDTEDEAALIKYGKSMVDDSGSPEGGMDMPESRFNFGKIIDETLDSLINKPEDSGIKRPVKKLNTKQRDNKTNPFVSPY
jgi:hypothetical protein